MINKLYEKIEQETKVVSDLEDMKCIINKILEDNKDKIEGIDATCMTKASSSPRNDYSYGKTVLHFAIYNNNLALIKSFLSCNADIRFKDVFGRNYLHHAIIAGNKDIVEFFLKQGLNVNEKDDKGFTPLHCAVMHGHTEIVRLLITHKANINECGNHKTTPLHNAVSRGRKDIVTLLIEQNASTIEKDESGLTALNYADLKKHEDTMYADIAVLLKEATTIPAFSSKDRNSREK